MTLEYIMGNIKEASCPLVLCTVMSSTDSKACHD